MRSAALSLLFLTTLAPLLAVAIEYDEVTMTCLVNKERRKHGLSPLGMDPRLAKAAKQHSQDQARRGKMSHTGSDGSSASDRVSRCGFKWRSVAENVAYGYRSMEEVMRKWMNSSGHRKNILGASYTMFGSGIANKGSTTYFTQNFGSEGGKATNVPKCDGSDSAYGGDADQEDDTTMDAYGGGGSDGADNYDMGGDDSYSGGNNDSYGQDNNYSDDDGSDSYGGKPRRSRRSRRNSRSSGGRKSSGGDDNDSDYSSGGGDNDYSSGGSDKYSQEDDSKDGSYGGSGGRRSLKDCPKKDRSGGGRQSGRDNTSKNEY